MSDFILLLWYSFYAQFELITRCLRYIFEDQQPIPESYVWYHNNITYDIPTSIFIISGLVWDIILIMLIRKYPYNNKVNLTIIDN